MINYGTGNNGAGNNYWQQIAPGFVQINNSTTGFPIKDLAAVCNDGASNASWEINPQNPSFNIAVSLPTSNALIDINPGDLALISAAANKNSTVNIESTYVRLRNDDFGASDYGEVQVEPKQSTLHAYTGSSGLESELIVNSDLGIALKKDGNTALGINANSNIIVGIVGCASHLNELKETYQDF
jgi:hypothetical protein